MIVVDSSVWVDYFNGVDTAATAKLDGLLGTTRVIVGDLILVEVLQGFRVARDLRRARQLFDLLEFREMVGRTVALASVQNYRRLRQRGATVRKTIDVVIGTFCIEHGLPLLHSDRDFRPLEKHLGLQVPD